MKLYKVIVVYYFETRSFLPVRGPTENELAQCVVGPFPEAVEFLTKHGYSNLQADGIVKGLWFEMWFERGIRDTLEIKHQILRRIRLMFMSRQEPMGSAPMFPPVVYYVVAAVLLAMVVIVVVNPEFKQRIGWIPPCNMYLGVYEESMWFVCCLGTLASGATYYEAWAYESPALLGYTRGVEYPGGYVDRLWFNGGIRDHTWRVPYFRVYRWIYADCHFCGYLTNIGAGLYKSKQGHDDPWAPPPGRMFRRDQRCYVRSIAVGREPSPIKLV